MAVAGRGGVEVAMADPQTAIPAATLVIFRDGERPARTADGRAREGDGRSRAARWCFPGGRIDPGDHALRRAIGAGDDEPPRASPRSARRSRKPACRSASIADCRPRRTRARCARALHAGDGVRRERCDDAGLTLDLDALVPFARWLPAHAPHAHLRHALLSRPPARRRARAERRRDRECPRCLGERRRRCSTRPMPARATMIFPTRRNLERLALFARFRRGGRRRARAIRSAPITPWTEDTRRRAAPLHPRRSRLSGHRRSDRPGACAADARAAPADRRG